MVQCTHILLYQPGGMVHRWTRIPTKLKQVRICVKSRQSKRSPLPAHNPSTRTKNVLVPVILPPLSRWHSPPQSYRIFPPRKKRNHRCWPTMPLTWSDCCKMACSLILPPVGVFFETGCSIHLAVNILLTLLFYVPGLIHACYIICKY